MQLQLPRRSLRLQQKRDAIQQLQSGQNSITSITKSRKRKRNKATKNNKYEPAKKRQKRSHQSTHIIHSNLFNDELDQRRYINIFTSIQSSELCLIHIPPLVLIKEISEFAIGSFRDCYNIAHCGNIIHTLNQNNTDIDNALMDGDILFDSDQLHLEYLKERAISIIHKTKYFWYLSDYFCSECIDGDTNGLELCSVCNKLCIDNNINCSCGHNLVYCKQCVSYCSYCDIPVCHQDDDTKCHRLGTCHQIIKCADCRKKMCLENSSHEHKCGECWEKKKCE